MGTCIICGTAVDGHVCPSHEEDIAFIFTGDRFEQLKPGRFYEGTVDGIAEFGVFVTIGESVTGLLHQSELDTRLEGLTWDEGDTVFAQVLDVHENGNIDLGWSIRRSQDEFRGTLVQTPDGDVPIDEFEDPAVEGESPPSEATTNGGATANSNTITVTTRSASESADDGSDLDAADRGPRIPDRSSVASLADRVGSRVSIEGRIVGIRQTSGPTIFKVKDETGVVPCAGFDGAGERAFPEIDAGDIVRLFGEVERRRGDIQIELETLEGLDADEAESVLDRLDDVISARATPDSIDLVADHAELSDLLDDFETVVSTIRRAIFDTRPILVRHTSTAEGYLSGAALERAVLPLIRGEHRRQDAEFRYFDRQPLRSPSYDMEAATGDIARMLANRDRHGEKVPLVILVDTGTTLDSKQGLEFLSIYDVNPAVISASPLDDDIASEIESLVQSEAQSVTSTLLATTVAANVNPETVDEIRHLPAASYWSDPPAKYVELATESGYDRTALSELREAVALEAYYQAHEDKRELIADLLFTRESDVRSLASHISEQFRIKLDGELETVRPHLERYQLPGITVSVLDLDAYTHRFDFPPNHLLLDAIHRRAQTDDGSSTQVTIGFDEGSATVRSSDPISIPTLAERIGAEAPESAVSARTDRHGGQLRFLVGERESVRVALLDAVEPALSG